MKRTARDILSSTVFHIFFVFAIIALDGSNRANAQGVTENKIVFGVSSALTGPLAARSAEVNRGAQIYFDKINKAGGVFSRKIELIYYDDAYDPKKTNDNVRKLVEEDQVFALFHLYGSPGNAAALPFIKVKKVPSIFPLTGADFLRYPPIHEVFNLKNSYRREGETLIQFLIEKKKLTKIALLYQEDAFGSSARSATQLALAGRDLKLVAEGTYQRNADDIDVALTKISAASPEAIMLFAVGNANQDFISKWDKKFGKIVFALPATSVTADFPNLIKGLKSEVYVSQTFPFFKDTSIELVRNYLRDAAEVNVTPGPGGIEGYANAVLLTEVLKKMGSAPSRDLLITTFESLGDYNLLGLPLRFDSGRHQGSESSFMVKVEGGKFIPQTEK